MKLFFGGGRGAWLRTPLRDRARGTGPSLAFNTIGDEGYVNSVQPPLSEIPGSAADIGLRSCKCLPSNENIERIDVIHIDYYMLRT